MTNIRTYRGKRIENGEWVYGCLINNLFFKWQTREPIPYIVDPAQYEDYDSFDDIGDLAVQVDPETVGQYTGMQDRNGKEIFEGDIINVPAWKMNGEVNFTSGMFKVRDRMRAYFNPSLASFMVEVRCDVIGNIHDNPELLEVSNG